MKRKIQRKVTQSTQHTKNQNPAQYVWLVSISAILTIQIQQLTHSVYNATEYERGCEIRSLPCGHDFCRECIDPWLEEHTSCPACRQRVENVRLDQPSWAVHLGALYSPNRRNPRFNVSREHPQFDPLESNYAQAGETPTIDDWRDQPATVRRSLNPMRYFMRTSGHTAVLNEETVETELELV